VFSNWVTLSLLYTFLGGALVNVLNGHFISKRLPELRSFLFIIGTPPLIAGVALLLCFPFPQDVEIGIILLAVIAALLRTIASIMMYYMVKHEEITRVSSLGSVSPIFVAILAAVFLGDTISSPQLFAILIVVVGVIAISIKFDNKQSLRFLYKQSCFALIACLFYPSQQL